MHNVIVTNRPARFLRPAEGAERVLRSVTISLDKRYAFARQLVNTGRMSVPNEYNRSSACTPEGGRALQNVALRWADGTLGHVADLLQWSEGRLLLLVFGLLTKVQTKRIIALKRQADIRCVQVIGQLPSGVLGRK